MATKKSPKKSSKRTKTVKSGSRFNSTLAVAAIAGLGFFDSSSLAASSGSKLPANNQGLGQQIAAIDKDDPAPELVIDSKQSSEPLPEVTLTAAAKSAVKGQPILLTASSGGTVTKIEFYAGFKLKGQATSSPYQFSWSPRKKGTNVLVAKAYLTDGRTAFSPPVSIEVKN